MSYEKYRKELFDELAELPGVEAGDRETVRRALESYFRQRAGRIENLLELLEPSDRFTHGTWLDRAKQASHVARYELEKLKLAGTSQFLARVMVAEHRFFFLLSVSQIPVARDKMVRQAANLEKAMKEFDAKWQKLSDIDDGLDERLKKAAEQYEKMLDEAAQKAAETEKQAKERMADYVSKAIKVGLLGVDLGVVEKVIGGALTAITRTLDQTEARRQEIFVLLSREEQVIHSFRDGRHLVAEFLEDHSYPRVKAAWTAGEDAAGEFAKQIAVEGQKDDAAEFAKQAEDELAKVFAVAERAYKEFAKRHEHLFFGPVGSQYVQELSEIDTWKDKSRRWRDLREDFDDLLRERFLRVSDDTILDVNLDGLVESDRRKVAAQLKDGLEKLMRAWNDWKDFNREDPDFILENREEMQSTIKAFRD